MSDSQQIRVRISELSNEDLFKMVNEEIIDYGKEEINLAYEEMAKRDLLPADEAPQPVVSTFGCLIGLAFGVLEVILIHGGFELLTYPRAVALAAFVSLIADYWYKPRPNTTFLKWVLWDTSMVLSGSFALWDIPNLLRKQIPIALAFGIPALIYSLTLYWVSKPNAPREKSKITTWLVGCIIFTILYSWLMSSLG